MRKWKIVLIGFVLIFFISLGTVYFYIKSTANDIVIDCDIEEIIETQYTFELPEDRGSSPFFKKEEEASQITNESKIVHYNKENTNENAHTNNTEGTPAATPEVILESYRPAIESLESQANRKINALVETAFSEYSAKKQTGEKVSIGYFYNKYSAAAKELETKTDQAFAYILSTIEADLEQNGFGVEHVKEYEEHYEAIKKERRAELLEKAKDRVF